MSRNPLDQLVPRPAPGPSAATSLLWGAVQSVNPLTVLPDGASLPVEDIASLESELYRGDRVFMGLQGRRMTVLGKAGTPNTLIYEDNFEDTPTTAAPTLPAANAMDSVSPDGWVQVLHATLTNGTVNADTAFSYTGARALKMYAASGGISFARGPIKAVTPGARYLLSFKVLHTSADTGNFFMRVAGGSTKALTEYPGNAGSNGISMSPTMENNDIPQGYSGSAFTASGWQAYSTVIEIPTGINYMALRPLVYVPSANSTYYIDDIRVRSIRADEGMWPGDSGWCSHALLNSWVNYGSIYEPFGVRRINGVLHLRGLIRNGSSATAVMATLEKGLRTNAVNIFSVDVSPGNAVGRVDIYPNGNIQGNSGINTTWVSLSGVSYPVVQ